MGRHKKISQNRKEYRLLRVIKSDFKRYVDKDEFNLFDIFKIIFREECLVFLISFRIAQRIKSLRNPLLRIPLKLLHTTIVHRVISISLGIHIHSKCNLGTGFYIGHPGTIFIAPTDIGKLCNISHEVTIGHGKAGDKYGIPKIGSHVYIGPGAKLFGDIMIENNVSIGANAVVTKNIPENAIVVGNPGRVIGYQDINPQIHNTGNKSYVGIMHFIRNIII